MLGYCNLIEDAIINNNITFCKGADHLDRLSELEISSLSEAEKLAIGKLKLDLKEEFLLCDLILFGSKARGDSKQGSDVDLLVVVEDEGVWENKSKLSDLAFESNLQYFTGLSCILQNKTDWDQCNDVLHMFKDNVLREGILIDV